ncbi:PilX N-terminal domain-containing pilus assembly protein [Planctomycetota bacterium]
MTNAFNEPRSTIHNPRQGIVLLVVLGVLALLSVLAITFVSMTRLERQISRNYVDHTRAVLAAESGIEAAIAGLSGFAGGVLRPREFAHMQYNPDDPTADLAKAGKLSFMSSQTGPGDKPISGAISSTYTENGDYYLLKVEDESGKLNLNDGNALMHEHIPGSERLTRLIANLGDILFGAPKGTDIAAAIMYKRTVLGGRFSIMTELRDALVVDDPFNLGPVLTENQWRRLEPHITIYSWQDPDVIKPNPAWGTYEDAKELYGNPPDNGFPKYGFPFMRWEEVQNFNDGDDSNGIHDYGYRLEPRSPVNINTASRELIQALLAGLECWTVFEGPNEQNQHYQGGYANQYGYWILTRINYPNFLYETTAKGSDKFHTAANRIVLDAPTSYFRTFGLPFARLRNTKIPDLIDNASFSAALADDVYSRIHGLGTFTNPNPLENWREFKFYLDNVIRRAKAGTMPELAIDDPFAADESEATWTYDREGDFQFFNEYYRDLILANFDPNTMTNDFNPDLVVYRFTDKADLITYSTEFCFEPTGTFRIESSGMVQGDGDSPLRAKQSVEAVVRMFELKRLTTQAQLVGNDTSITAISEQFGNNESPYPTKWGDVVGYDNGARLVSHPEPLVAALPDKFEFVKNARFDGRIGLAQIKHNTERELKCIEYTDTQTWTYETQMVPAVLWSYFEGSMNAINLGSENGGIVPTGISSEQGTFYKYNMLTALAHYKASVAAVYEKIDHPITEELREHENPLMTTHFKDGPNQKPGTLFVDGAFSEAWKCPAYPLIANNQPHLSFWDEPDWSGSNQTVIIALKPGFLMKDSNRCRNFFSMGQGGIGSKNFATGLAISRITFSFPYHGMSPWWNPPGNAVHQVIFGWGYGASCTARGTNTDRTNFVGTDLDLTRDYKINGENAYHLEGRRWNIMAASWEFGESKYFNINGQSINEMHGSFRTSGRTLRLPFKILSNTNYEPEFLTPIRLGAFVRPQGHLKMIFEPADSTFAEFIFYKNVIADYPTFINLGESLWDDGFYYNDSEELATYITPEINLSAKQGKAVTIRSISWTGRWPQYVSANTVMDDDYSDPVWGHKDYQIPQWLTADPGKWAPFLVDIQTYDTWHGTEMINSGGSTPTNNDGRKLRTDEPIKLKFYFNLADDQVEPLRESPYLDDITITYIPHRGTQILFYQMH